MDNVEFNQINKVVLDTLNIGSDCRLTVIGSWYFKFLNSEEVDLKLSLPSFDLEFSKIAYNYIRLFSLTYNLLSIKKLDNFENTCLFDIFKYMPKAEIKNIDNYLLNFKSSKNGIRLWGGGDTITELNEFLPVFKKEQIFSADLKIIYNSFNLFKSIRKNRLINCPLLIDFKKEVLSFNIFNDFEIKNNVSEINVLVDRKIDDDTAIDKRKEIESEKISKRVSIRYPNSKRIHPYLIENIGAKRFDLIFMNRFAYQDKDEQGITLLPREYSENKSTSILADYVFEIINTEHNKVLFNLLKGFKNKWTNLALNHFVAPFPKEWFLFVNKSWSKEEWYFRFKNDYPLIANLPFISEVKMIISELHDLDWIKDAFDETCNSTFFIPEFKGLKMKRLEKVFNSFKKYIITLYPKIVFIEEKLDYNYDNIILLDAFNKVDIANRGQLCLNGKLKIVVPDFIYFSYQPFIKYYLFDYQANILINKTREKLDANFETNNGNIQSIKNILFKEINTERNIYNKKYDIEIEEPSVADIENNKENDNEYTGEEEAEFGQITTSSRNSVILKITTAKNEEIKVSDTEIVLVQRNCFSRIPAKKLLVGDLFLLNKDLNDLIKDDNLYNRLSEIPKEIKYYQDDLYQDKNIYKTLKTKGISYINESYFKNTYLLPIEKINNNNFRVPRRKNDWRIICDLLNISQGEMDIAFIAYYGREKKNRIKELYKEVINLFLEKEYFSMAEDPIVLSEIESIIEKFNDIFKLDNYYNPQEIAISITSTIINELKFKEIKNLKYE